MKRLHIHTYTHTYRHRYTQVDIDPYTHTYKTHTHTYNSVTINISYNGRRPAWGHTVRSKQLHASRTHLLASSLCASPLLYPLCNPDVCSHLQLLSPHWKFSVRVGERVYSLTPREVEGDRVREADNSRQDQADQDDYSALPLRQQVP